MKNLFVVFLLLSSHVFAQDYWIRETPFNKFIKQPFVEWAIAAHDTISFDVPDFSTMLLNKIKKGQLKISDVLEPGTQGEAHVRLKSQNSADSIFLSDPALITDVGEQGISKWIFQKDRIYDQLKSSPFYVSQVFYIAGGKLKSYVPYISPTAAHFVTSTGLELGSIRFFTTAINFSYAFTSSPKDKIIYLTQTRREISFDSIPYQYYRLKETFGKDMIMALWPDIISDKSNMHLVSTGKRINSKEFLKGEWLEPAPLDIYDSLGNKIGEKNVYPEVMPYAIKRIAITQSWFYNYTWNIVYNKISDIILYAPFTDSSGIMRFQPAVKIVY